MQNESQLDAKVFFNLPREEAKAMACVYIDTELAKAPWVKTGFRENMVNRAMKFYDDHLAKVQVTRTMYRAERNPSFDSLNKYFASLMTFMRESLGKPALAPRNSTIAPMRTGLNAENFFRLPRKEAELYLKDYLKNNIPSNSQFLNNPTSLIIRGMQFWEDFKNGVSRTELMYRAERNPSYEAIKKYFGTLMTYARENLAARAAVPRMMGASKTLGVSQAEQTPYLAGRSKASTVVPLNASLFFGKTRKEADQALRTYLEQPLLNGARTVEYRKKKKKLYAAGMSLYSWYKQGFPCTLNGWSTLFGLSAEILKKHLGPLLDSSFWREAVLEARNGSVLNIEELLAVPRGKAALKIRKHIFKKLGDRFHNSTKREGLVQLGMSILDDFARGTLKSRSYYGIKIKSTPDTIKKYFSDFFPQSEEQVNTFNRMRNTKNLQKLQESALFHRLKKPSCLCCGVSKWRGRDFSLFGVIDHIDGCNKNQKASNLRPICASCHALTTTFNSQGVRPVPENSDPATANLICTQEQYNKKAQNRMSLIARQTDHPEFFGCPVGEIADGKHPDLKGNVIIPRYIGAGLKPASCEACFEKTWLKFPILPILQIHHVSGVDTDHSLENVQLLCPNCHMLSHYSG